MAKCRTSGATFATIKDPNIDRISVRESNTHTYPVMSPDIPKLPRRMNGGRKEQQRKIYERFTSESRGQKISFSSAIEPAIYDKKTLEESWENLSRVKMEFMSSYKAINNLGMKGTILEVRPLHTTRSGNVKGEKRNWDRLFSVRGTTVYKSKPYFFEMMVSHSKGQKYNHVYSFDIRKKE